MRLTPEDIRAKRFSTTRLRPGYVPEDVDTLLERAEAALAAGDPGAEGAATADEVEGARFRPTWLSPGYAEDEVDDFLDLVAAELRALGPGTREHVRDRGREPDPAAGTDASGPAAVPMAAPAAPAPGSAASPAAGPPPMRAEDARGIRFSGTRLRSGYAQEEVDGFLDRAEATLAALSAGRSEADPLTAAQVEAARFSVTRLQPGYDASEVDEFLDALAAELRRHGLD
ncbi:DivIVA domain-containing protein [Spinactinospora alkalitolerans]|uniref:Cell wall synthesis protein Wag31 n=1 Tax=Spinactinospora alkalitolerans TaxID=687207 RepID=A0A852TQG0_9ACTN|nr:DivIVA domain-containing protein [Spinactinospora alkalitolerans]NYE45062.1 DivIVA domain-containing protein [Spinactinospora alkalitolerans]